ncbi:diguanylate cyclase [Tropicibacter sp. R15_0]|uniref:diguanylate cyclase n=1 Tax=Tropicibacter sp. R15_0 TaxID=2821101 RepID=UPI001AD979A5|nr:diguanylate cyclase [Tropicibacter sp. R15_0]MBO9468305.1 diguanylate cyclase [Tropicibacter sp. R15_0]
MTGRILVVDPVPTNRIILRVKLSAAFYEVVQAASGKAALAMMKKAKPDLVMTASDLPDMTGRALVQALRGQDGGVRLPVVMLHGDDDPGERLASLAAGADDVLARPIDDLVMLARLRSLLRARDAEAELQLRDDTRRALGLAEQAAEFATPAHVALIPTGRQPEAEKIVSDLSAELRDRITLVDPEDALRERRPAPDVIVIAEGPGGNGEGLTLLAQMRASTLTRHASLIYVAQPHQRREAASALDMGANDLLAGGLELQELSLRLKKQIERKRTADRLRANMQDGLRAAVTDPLTGLYNRRYTLPHLNRLAERSARQGRPYAVLVLDLDHFKQVNDKFGHPAGDAVLVSLAQRLKDNLRAADLISRWGGEEFLIAMPDTGRMAAQRTAERLCQIMAEHPVMLPGGARIAVTLSIGVATASREGETAPLALIDRADKALYMAKQEGRNRVVTAERTKPLPRRNPTQVETVQASPVLSQNGTGPQVNRGRY